MRRILAGISNPPAPTDVARPRQPRPDVRAMLREKIRDAVAAVRVREAEVDRLKGRVSRIDAELADHRLHPDHRWDISCERCELADRIELAESSLDDLRQDLRLLLIRRARRR